MDEFALIGQVAGALLIVGVIAIVVYAIVSLYKLAKSAKKIANILNVMALCDLAQLGDDVKKKPANDAKELARRIGLI